MLNTSSAVRRCAPWALATVLLSGCVRNAHASLNNWAHTTGHAGTELSLGGGIGLGDASQGGSQSGGFMFTGDLGVGADWYVLRPTLHAMGGLGGFGYLGNFGWRFALEGGGRFILTTPTESSMAVVQASGGFMGSVFQEGGSEVRNLGLGLNLSLGAGFGGTLPAGFLASLAFTLNYDLVRTFQLRF